VKCAAEQVMESAMNEATEKPATPHFFS